MAWTLRKPALLDPLTLVDKLQDAPERGEGRNTKDRGQNNARDNKRQNAEGDARNKEHPPTACAQIVLSLDDNRMEKAYDKKGRKTYDDACEIHIS